MSGFGFNSAWYPVTPVGFDPAEGSAWKLLNAVVNGKTEASLTEDCLLELQGQVWDVKWYYSEDDCQDPLVFPQSILEVAKSCPGVEYKVVELLEQKLQDHLSTSFYNKRINLQEKFSTFSNHWSPRVVAEMNDYQLKIAKVKGEFVWHQHADTDEVFIIIKGSLFIDFETGPIELTAGEMCVVKKGDQHKPYCIEECQILLVEPKGVVNTGDAAASTTLTAENDRWV